MKLDARNRGSMKAIIPYIMEACHEKLERDQRRGIQNRPIRAMVAGIPNVGKSTFINSLAGKAAAKTGNKPGVTKGNQWIRLNKQVELLDTPGILWPRFDDEEAGTRLAFLGSVNDEILNKEEMATELITWLTGTQPGLLGKHYAIDEEGKTPFELLESLAKARACLLQGGRLDTLRASRLLLDDFRGGRLGRITLELPEDVPSAVTDEEG